MKKYSFVVLLFALCMLVTAGGAAWIEAPEGVLISGSTGVFSVFVSDLTDAQGVHFNLTFDSARLSVEGISANNAIPGSSVTSNIDNETGWAQVAVTNTEGITTGDAWWSIPLVDITFRSTGVEGESPLEFADAPTYSQGEGFMPVEFDWVYSGSIRVVERPSTIRAPSDTLAYGQPGTFAVGVDNVTGATKIWFELMYDGSYLIIDDIAPALPGAMIIWADASNGVYDEEFEPYHLEFLPEEVRLNLQQHHGRNFAWVDLEIPGGLTTTECTDIVDITFRPTNLSGTGDLEFHYYSNYLDENESTQIFDLQIPGQITTSGGGVYPGLGEFRAPSGTVDVGSQTVLPIMAKSLNNAERVFVQTEWNQTIVDVTSVSLSATARDAGVTLDSYRTGSYYYEPIEYLNAFIGNLTNLNTESWTSLLDLTVRANATSGRTPMTIIGHSYTVPHENVTIMYPAVSLEDGQISITVPNKADLVGTIVDPLRYVKKYADDSLHLTQTMVIENIGNKIVTEDFKIQGEFGSSKANITVTDDIAPGANITYHMTVHVVPGYGEKTDIILTDKGNVKEYEITTAGNVAVGDYEIGLAIDVDNDVDEINEENNYVQTRAEITRPDLIPIWEMEFVHGIPSSNTTILDTSVTPGIWKVTLGVKNIGNVFAIPTTLNYSMDERIPQVHSVPRLEPGENWTMTTTIDAGRAINTYRVEVNADRAEVEINDDNNVYEGRIRSIAPVTVVLPKVSVSAGDCVEETIRITNISRTAPVTAFEIPVIYDPTVCTITPVSTYEGVTATPSYGRIMLTANNLDSPLYNDAEIATLKLEARTDTGRTSVLDTSKNAYVKTENGAFLELEVYRGAFVQDNKTDAAVTVFASPRGPVNQNQTISVTIQNQRLNPVVVSANLFAGDDHIWAMQDISLAGRASRTFTVNTWKPTVGGTYFLNATIAGDDIPAGNSASRSIFIDDYKLNITDNPNKYYWDAWYGYDRSVMKDEYFTLGTYFTANQASRVNATLAITYPDGAPIDLTDDSVFELYRPYYQAHRDDVYAYDSEWNSVSWYYIRPKQLGDFNYSITLEARDMSTYVTGTIKVREPYVDIKVMDTILVTGEGGTMTFPVFNRTPSENREVQILLSAGADGRTLQGLESLIGYPHGCPEQVMSPALAALRVKQYYEERDALSDYINQTVRTTMQNALGHMNATGYNAQQSSGGWAWGTYSSPSMFYTFYPNYVITELLRDDDPEFWDVGPSMNGIDLNASANWLILRQKVDGHWSDWGYISNDVEWTGFISENLVGEYPYLNATMQERVNTSLEDSCGWLLDHDYTNEDTQALSYAILGLVAIRDHGGIGDTGAINDAIEYLRDELKKEMTKTSEYEPTASAILALYKSGTDATSLSDDVSYLIGNRAGRSYSGGWGSTRTSAAVINTLTNVVPPADMDFTVDVEIVSPDGTTVWSVDDYAFNKNRFREVWTLNNDELNALYGFGELNGTAAVIISDKKDKDPDNVAKLSVSIDCFEQVPKSIAIATIPDRYIDPIATDFDLQIIAPAEGELKEGDPADVGFTINNNYADSIDQSIMIIEIAISNEVNFTGKATGADKAYYYGDTGRSNISHMYDATGKHLYIYPGSDDESRPSVRAGESKTFYVPLTFGASGNITVEARAYPMYNDTWMALGTGSTYVKGYGNVTLAAVDETDSPVNAEFYVDGDFFETGVSEYNTRLLEGNYPIAIKRGDAWINSSVNVAPSESVTYTAHFASDRSVPYIAQAEGTAGEIWLMPPEIEDTTDDTSPNHWNAAIPAMKSFNSTIASSGGRATISVDVPLVNRTVTNETGTFTLSVGLNDRPTIVSLYNGTAWSSYECNMSLLEDRLTINDVDTSKIQQVNVTFIGRKYGDANNDGDITTADAFLVVKARFNQVSFTENQRFYADVNNDGVLTTADAFLLVKQRFKQVDYSYQPK